MKGSGEERRHLDLYVQYILSIKEVFITQKRLAAIR